MLKKLWDNAEEYLLVYSLMLSVAIVFMQVVMRYIFSNSLSWSEELARYLFLWQIWLGASYAVKEHRHLRIEIIQDLIKNPVCKKYFELFVMVLWLGFSIFLAYEGYLLTDMQFSTGQVAPAMRIPIGYAYASVPVGSALMALRLVVEMVKLIKTPTQQAKEA
jgi:TRAP-type C4-dicarboxylate transport system permease small subunit